MPLTTILLEYSSDPVSDSSPTYTTVGNDEFRGIEYWEGVSEEGAGFEPGGATIRLVNKNRKWEPLYSTNTIDTHQRFRLALNGTVEGEWFITGISIEYPAGTDYSEVVFTCGDGSEVLALDNLPGLDPPDAESYEDVVMADEPWGYWTLGDPPGTQASPVFRRIVRGKGKKRRKIKRRQGTQYFTEAEVGAAAGSAGVYKRLPELGQPGAIVGDSSTSVLFSGTVGSSGNYCRVDLADTDILARDVVTVGCWVYLNSVNNGPIGFVVGPSNASGSPIWILGMERAGGDGLFFGVNTGTTAFEYAQTGVAATTGVWTHVVGVFDGGGNIRLYVDGVVAASASKQPGLAAVAAGAEMGIGGWIESGAFTFSHRVAHVAVYERVLSAERILAQCDAQASGFPQQTAGERISAIATSALWSEAGIQTAGRDVQPRMSAGQPRLEEIEETMAAEGPSTLFYFEAGAPQYRGHEWRSTAAAYNTVQATFGQAEYGELPVDDLDPEYDHETFNVAQTSREGGMLVEVEDTTASGLRGRRVLDDYTGLLLTDDAEVESLANALVAQYKDPARTLREISVSGFDDARLAKLLSLKVGHLVRVNWSGETGARNGHTANIIRRHKTLEATEALGKTGGWLLRGVYTLSRGFDATDTGWLAGIVGRSEAGVTTNAG